VNVELNIYHEGRAKGNYDASGWSNYQADMGEYFGDRRNAVIVSTSPFKERDRHLNSWIINQEKNEKGYYKNGVNVKVNGKEISLPAMRFLTGDSKSGLEGYSIIIINWTSLDELNAILKNFSWQIVNSKWVKTNDPEENDEEYGRK